MKRRRSGKRRKPVTGKRPKKRPRLTRPSKKARTTKKKARPTKKQRYQNTICNDKYWKQNEPRLQWNSQSRCFSFDGTRFKGLTKCLKRRAYPDYKFMGKNKTAKTGLRRASKWAGMSRGSAVDQQVGTIVRYITKHKTDLKTLLTDTKYKKRIKKYTMPMLSYFVKRGWEPICTQLIVADRNARIATAVDLLCWSYKDKAYIMIEIKTGYAGWYKNGNSCLKRIPDTKTNSPYAQHQLQIAGTLYMFKKTYPGIQIKESIVLRVHASSDPRITEPVITTYPLQDWASRCIPTLLYKKIR